MARKLTDVSNFYLGDDLVSRLFIGDTLIYNGDNVPELESSQSIYYDWTSLTRADSDPLSTFALTDGFNGNSLDTVAWNIQAWSAPAANTLTASRVGPNGAGRRDMLYNASFDLDHYCAIDVYAAPGTTAVKLITRAQGATAVHYAAQFSDFDGEWQIQKYSTATSLSILAYTATAPPTTPYRMLLTTETTGSDVTLTLYEVSATALTQRLTWVDVAANTPIMAGNQVGLKVEGVGALGDNWEAGNMDDIADWL